MDKIVQAHQAIKAARTAKRHAWEQEDADLEADQQKLKVFMLEILNATGTKSMVCEHGTVYRREVLKPSGADWGAIWDWMKEHDAADLVERRLKVTFIKDYMDQNDGAIPPGINVHREFEVSVRRPNDPSGSSKRGAPNDDAE
jgi:hypothetical protein